MSNFKESKIEGVQYAKIGHKLTDLIKTKSMAIGGAVIYSYIGVKVNPKDDFRSTVAIRDFSSKFGYSKGYVRLCLGELEINGFIKSEKTSGEVTKFLRVKSSTSDRFERYTKIFILSSSLSTKEKEFLIMLSPFVYKEDSTIPNNISKVSKFVGLSRASTSRRINDLINKGYISKVSDTSNKLFVDLYLAQMEGVETACVMLDDTEKALTVKERELIQVSSDNEKIIVENKMLKGEISNLKNKISDLEIKINTAPSQVSDAVSFRELSLASDCAAKGDKLREADKKINSLEVEVEKLILRTRRR